MFVTAFWRGTRRRAPGRCLGGGTPSSAITTCCPSSAPHSGSSSPSGFRHGGFGALFDGATPAATSLTQLTGIAASFAGLAGLALAGRPLAIEHLYGLDRVFIWHRILGETMAVLIGFHVVAGVFAWGLDTGFGPAIIDLTGRKSYMAMAFVGALIIGAVTITSLRSIRRQMAYETWYFIHLLAYAGFVMSFSHEIVWGELFSDNAFARWLWIALHVGVGVMLIRGRWGRLIMAGLRPLHIAETHKLNDNTTEIRLAGGRLNKMIGDAGQFVIVRPLAKGLWWQAHPFSLSAAPTTDGLKISVKLLGDGSAAIGDLPGGTRVLVEGPFGAFTPRALHPWMVLLSSRASRQSCRRRCRLSSSNPLHRWRHSSRPLRSNPWRRRRLGPRPTEPALRRLSGACDHARWRVGPAR